MNRLRLFSILLALLAPNLFALNDLRELISPNAKNSHWDYLMKLGNEKDVTRVQTMIRTVFDPEKPISDRQLAIGKLRSHLSARLKDRYAGADSLINVMLGLVEQASSSLEMPIIQVVSAEAEATTGNDGLSSSWFSVSKEDYEASQSEPVAPPARSSWWPW